MRGATHLVAGLAVASLWPEPTLAIAAGVAVGSILPDIDHPYSIVGRRVPILPRLLPHRTITHGLLFALVCGVLYLPLGVGVLLHLLLDALNPAGVPLLWPRATKYHIPYIHLVRSGGKIDYLLGVILWAFIVWYWIFRP